jgi:hypothetical protein
LTEDAAPRLFGFAQFDLAGTLPLADGRYVVRDNDRETVLVVETLGAPSAPRRRRRRAHESDPGASPPALPLARATVVSASQPFAGETAAHSWLDELTTDEAALDELIGNATEVLNHALHVHAVISEDPHTQELSPSRAAAMRIGYGSGEQVARGEWAVAREIDAHGGTSRRRRRHDALRPQERTAAILGGREQLDACETLLLRVRADLDAGRAREAALQLRAGLDALLVELQGQVDDPAHDADMTTLEARRNEAATAADAATQGDLDATQLKNVEELTGICARILRRRRVLKG